MRSAYACDLFCVCVTFNMLRRTLWLIGLVSSTHFFILKGNRNVVLRFTIYLDLCYLKDSIHVQYIPYIVNNILSAQYRVSVDLKKCRYTSFDF